MCDPISLVGFAITAASSITGYMSQSAAADAQTKRYQQNAMNASRAFVDTQTALNEREEQQQAADGQQRMENDLATRSAQSTALAAGAAGGVQGLSLEGLLGDFGARNARADAAINTQEGWNIAQLQSEKVGAADQMVGRIDSMAPGVQPSFLDAGLGIISGGIKATTGAMRSSSQQGGTSGSSLFGIPLPGNLNGTGY
jgi:hypothetical protein